jgi:hypothetical protein
VDKTGSLTALALRHDVEDSVDRKAGIGNRPEELCATFQTADTDPMLFAVTTDFSGIAVVV